MTVKHNNDTKEYFFEEGCFITEYWNNPNDNDVSIAQARLPVGQSTLPHLLHNTTERYFILSGEGLVHLSGKTPVPVRQNDIVFIQAGEKQSIENTGETDLVFLAICQPRFKIENYAPAEI